MPNRILVLILLVAFTLTACGGVSGPSTGGGGIPTLTQLSYDGAVTLVVRAGSNVPGTNISYQGRAPDGRAILNIGGLQSLKSTFDSLNWSGPLASASVDLNLRVLTYDDSNLTLGGTVHLGISQINPQPGNPSTNPVANYLIPVTYTVQRGTAIPGTIVQYVGSRTEGAEFLNLDQYPYRQRLDSVVWQGYLRDKVALRLDLRLLNFGDDSALLGGTAKVMFEQ